MVTWTTSGCTAIRSRTRWALSVESWVTTVRAAAKACLPTRQTCRSVIRVPSLVGGASTAARKAKLHVNGESHAEIDDRRPESLAAVAYGVMRGARIVRVHDVAGTVRVCRTVEAILAEAPVAVP